MPRAYVSSTFNDLREHRAVAITTIESLDFGTSAMEKYFASDERPLDLCLSDLQRCDLYIGIFAWRYGHIPAADNPERRSITECELREAIRRGLPCLIFLSDDDRGRWPRDGGDDTARIERLREELTTGEHGTAARFDTPDKLGLEISKALHAWKERPDFTRYRRALVDELAELPELPGHIRNLSLEQLIRIVVTLPPREKEPRVVELPQAVAAERAWILSGEGGAGKTTALRFLAHHFAAQGLNESAASSPIPVYIRLGAGRRPLRERIHAALQRPGFRCSSELVDRWIADQPFLFLVDQLEDSDSRAILEELQDLMRGAPHSRLVVASRPLAALRECPWPIGRIVPPSDSSLRTFLHTLLGAERGAGLFDVLLQNGVVEPFRRPLFARLLALSSPALFEQKRFTLGEVFRDVLEGRFLREWERQPESKIEGGLVLDLVAAIANEMVHADAQVLDRESVLQRGAALAKQRGIIDVRAVETLVERTISSGLLTEGEQGLQFWHTSFRDYFAARWLQQHANGMTIYRRSWQPRWYDALVLYFGFLDGRLLERRLAQLLTGLRLVMAPLTIMGVPSLSSRLIFILRCLVQARDGAERSRERFVRRLPRDTRHFYLSGATTPMRSTPKRRYFDEETYRYFCTLVGQLQIPAAFEYLKQAEWPLDCVAHGLIHDPDDASIERLVSSLVNTNAAFAVGTLLLTSPQPRCFAALQRAVRHGDDDVRRKTLSSLLTAASLLGHQDEHALTGNLADRWTPLLIDLVLHDAVAEVRTEALPLLRWFAPAGSRLPAHARDAFIRALSDPQVEMREHASAALRWGELKNHLDLAWRLLSEESLSLVFDGLTQFSAQNPPQFCRAVLKVLRRYAPEGSNLRAVAKSVLQDLRRQGVDGPLRTVALLIAAAWLGPLNGFQEYAVRALHALRLPWTVPWLIHVFESDAWQGARCVALVAIEDLLGNEAQAHVLRALADDEAEVCTRAAVICMNTTWGDDFREAARPLLFRLLDEESDDVRRYAKLALQKFGYLEKESWQQG